MAGGESRGGDENLPGIVPLAGSSPAPRTSLSGVLAILRGGWSRNRTGVHGVAVRYMATLSSSLKEVPRDCSRAVVAGVRAQRFRYCCQPSIKYWLIEYSVSPAAV